MPAMPSAITPRRLWVGLFALALLAFAGCAVGAVPCSTFKPLGLGLALAAAVASVFDGGRRAGDREPEPDEVLAGR
jgi:hypothetical protein